MGENPHKTTACRDGCASFKADPTGSRHHHSLIIKAPPNQFAANTLMNGDALPGWLREAGATPAPPAHYAPPPAPAPMPDPRDAAYYQQYAPQQQQEWPQQMASDPRDPRQQRLASPGAAIASNALFDEASLPEWLRQSGGVDGGGQPTMHQVAGYAPPSQMPFAGNQPYSPPVQPGFPVAEPSAPTAFPTLNQAVAPRGMPTSDPTQRGGAPGMAAQSLIDETALPTWLRSQPQLPQAQQSQLAQPPSALESAWARPQPPAAPQWDRPVGNPSHAAAGTPTMAAGSFVDDSALPAWLRMQSGGQVSPNAGYAAPSAASPDAGAGAYANAAANLGNRNGGGAQSMAPFYGAGTAAEPAPAHFSASDLIDPQALPGWVQRPSDQQASFSSSAGWSIQQPTARQQRVEPVDAAMRGDTRQQPAYDAGDAAPPVRGGATGAYPAAGSQIPQEELPPWLQGTPSRGSDGAAGGTPAYSFDDEPRFAQRNGRQSQQADGYEVEWDSPREDSFSYQDPYHDDVDPRQPGYAQNYDDMYDEDPRLSQQRGREYADAYGGPNMGEPAFRPEYERGYAAGSDEDYGDPDYDGAGDAWQPQEMGARGAKNKRGGWRRLFGRG